MFSNQILNLTAPSHYLNQCHTMLNFHHHRGLVTTTRRQFHTRYHSHQLLNKFENYLSKNPWISFMDQWVSKYAFENVVSLSKNNCCILPPGPDLIFVAYPQAVAMMPVAPLWSVLFFSMICVVTIDSTVRWYNISIQFVYYMLQNYQSPRLNYCRANWNSTCWQK